MGEEIKELSSEIKELDGIYTFVFQIMFFTYFAVLIDTVITLTELANSKPSKVMLLHTL